MYKDIYINQGSDYIDSIIMRTTYGSPVDITNYTFTGQLRRSYYSANASANLTITVTDASNGIASIVILAADTANIAAGRYVYDIKMYDTANVTNRISEGIAIVSPQVTMTGSPIQPY